MPELEIAAEQLDEVVREPPRLRFSEKDIPETVGSERRLGNVGMKDDCALSKLLSTDHDEVVTVISKYALPGPFCQMLLHHRLRDTLRYRPDMREPALLLGGVQGELKRHEKSVGQRAVNLDGPSGTFFFTYDLKHSGLEKRLDAVVHGVELATDFGSGLSDGFFFTEKRIEKTRRYPVVEDSRLRRRVNPEKRF